MGGYTVLDMPIPKDKNLKEVTLPKIFVVTCGNCKNPATLGWDDTNKFFVSLCTDCQSYSHLTNELLEKSNEERESSV